MRHKMKGRKLGTSHSHTKAMKVSLVQALFLNDRIKTTDTRAKEVRGDVDRIITWAKKGDLHSRRLAIAALGNDKDLVREIFEKVQQGMFEGRNGGYTRIMKLGPRKGDGAPMVILELVSENCVPKAERKKAAATKSTKTSAKKKATPTKKASAEAEKEDAKAQSDEKIEAEAQEEARESAEKAEAAAAKNAEAEAPNPAVESEEHTN